MSKISPKRVSAILQVLATPPTKPVGESPTTQTAHHTKASPTHQRNKTELRKNLKAELSKLDQNTDDFEDQALRETVKQILFWEFEDDILTHPELNTLIKTVSQAIASDTRLNTHLNSLYKNVLME